MTLAATLSLIWVLGAVILGLSPPRRQRAVAWVLLLAGIPLLGLATRDHGPLAGSLLFVLGALLLCCPRLPVSRRVQRWLWGAQ